MPNIKSAQKRVLVAKVKTERNKAIKSALKTDIKKYSAALESGNMQAAESALKTAQGALDSAALKGTIHKNKANRKKSRMAIALNKAKNA